MSKFKKIIAIFIIALFFVFTLSSCNKDNELGDNSKYYDTITKTLKLSKSYENKSFLDDGIGLATVDINGYTDGDTTRFKLASGEVVIIRYYEVDTPESTSSIEKWGKAASVFTKTRLQSATEIVLEATGPRAVHDSYGTRYLGYVWYKTAEYNEFKCLNLELVENGFSQDKGVNTSAYPYYSYFNQATKQAQKMQLRLFSKLDDPLYSTDPVTMTLKDFYSNTDQYYNTDTESGAKVKFYACLTSLYISDSGTYNFTATEIDPQTKETNTITIYAGYDSASASKMKLGHYYEIVGNVGKYGGKFQISNIVYDTIFALEGYTVVKQKDYFLTFDSSINYRDQQNETYYSDVTVVSSQLEGNVLTIVGTASLKTRDGYKDDVKTYTFKVNVSEGYVNNFVEGSKFSTSGYQFVKDSGIVEILSISNLIKK